MKQLTIGLLLAALLHAAPARADEAQRIALAEELVVLAELEKNFEQSFAMVKEMLPRQLGAASSGSSPEAKAKAIDGATEIYDLIGKELNWNAIKGDYIALYAGTFTEEELQGVIDFYKSDAGKAFVKKQPELMKKSMELNQAKMAAIMPKIQHMIMQKDLKNLAPARAPAK